jgi:ATP-binding cassette subfamily B protein
MFGALRSQRSRLGRDYCPPPVGETKVTSGLCRYREEPLRFIARYVRRRAFAHGAIVLCVLGAVGASVTTQFAVKMLVDALSRGPGASLAPWGAVVAIASLVAADNLLWRVACWIASRTFVDVTGDVRRELFGHLTGHAPSYFTERLPGTLTSRISATSNAVFQIEMMTMSSVLPPCATTLGAVILISRVNAEMAFVLVVVAAIVVAAIYRFAAAGRPLHSAFADRAALVDGEMVDVVANMGLTRAFGRVAHECSRLDATIGRELHARGRSLRHLEKLRIAHALTVCVMTVALLIWALSLWRDGVATAGDVVLIATLGLSLLSATRDLAVALVDVTQHWARLGEALSTLLSPHELNDAPGAAPLFVEGAHITVEHLSFRYPGGRPIFDNLSFEIPPGQRVGVVGESGAGKSTLAALLQRFYLPDGGRILIDGQDIAQATDLSLRQALAVVPQDTALFNRTLAENIRYGRPEASDEEVFEAAAAAQCLSFLDALPEGMETIVGDRGVKLSGGQRQRIAIARAFLRDAPLLLLDEATSSLDGESEEAVRRALDRLIEGRTVVAIAHRLSTLRNFDRILVLEGGRLIEDGAPHLLLRRRGVYSALVDRELRWLKEHAA